MWTIEEIPGLDQLPPADQLWIIALAVGENARAPEYINALRLSAERLEDLGCWVSGLPYLPASARDPSRPGCECCLESIVHQPSCPLGALFDILTALPPRKPACR